MTNERIQRINKLALKEKKEGLTAAEKEEQAGLRREYIDDLKKNLQITLDNTYIVSQDGTKRRLEHGASHKNGRLH